jgi:hypothetical protein
VNSRLAAAAALAWLAFGGASGAQTRFEATTQNAIEGVSGLRIITVRDRALNTCYLVFVNEPAPRGEARPAAAPGDLQQVRTERDQRLADLVHAYEQDRGAVPGTIIPNPLRYEFLGGATQIDYALLVLEQLFLRLEDALARLAGASRTTMTAVATPC